jgi:hypothetical protein
MIESPEIMGSMIRASFELMGDSSSSGAVLIAEKICEAAHYGGFKVAND